MAEIASTETVWEASADLDVDATKEPLVGYFVHVMYSSPYAPYDADRRRSRSDVHREWGEAVETVLDWLRKGDDLARVERHVRKMQQWEWGTVTADVESLREALERRYEIAGRDCETELSWIKIPGGIVVTCGVLPRAVDTGGL